MGWRRRQELPDHQVLNAARQYEAARKLLVQPATGSGVVWPLMNVAAIAIELHLKALSAEVIHTPDDAIPGLFSIAAVAAIKGHGLQDLHARIPNNTRDALEAAFVVAFPAVPETSVCEVLVHFERLFVSSRYPFEPGVCLSDYPLDLLMRFSAFLAEFVAGLATREWIEW